MLTFPVLTLLLSLCWAESWPPDLVNNFLEPLTYPTSEWRADDFGKDTSKKEIALLERFKPRVFIGQNSPLPVDFYTTYLPNTVVHNKDGEEVKRLPHRSYLKSIERKAGYYLDYRGPVPLCRQGGCSATPPIYGRVFHEELQPGRPVIVLKYNLVFPLSGLPDDLAWFQSLFAKLAGDLENWHELDIHGAIHLLLEKKTLRPLVLLLAQHNHFSSYAFGKDLPWPSDDRVRICFSVRSNEPYPCHSTPNPKRYRATGDPTMIRYLLTGEGGFWTGSHDIVMGPNSGGTEVPTVLTTLPSRDPLYVSWISLGDDQKLFGLFSSFFRKGPPGINMNTWPQLKQYSDIAKFWYFKKGDETALKLVEENMKDFFSAHLEPIRVHNEKHLLQALGASNKQK